MLPMVVLKAYLTFQPFSSPYEHILCSRYCHDEFSCNNFTWFDLTNVITTVKTFAIQTIKKHEILVTKEMRQSFKFQALHLSHSCSNSIYCLLCWLNIFLLSCVTITFLRFPLFLLLSFFRAFRITWRIFDDILKHVIGTQRKNPASKQFINSN